MTRALLLVALLLIVALIPALLDHDEHEQLGSGSRVAETVPHVASPSPAEHRLVALNFELVRVVKPKVRARARTAPRRAVVAAAGIWDRIAQCESGGDWHSTAGLYEGGLQFHPKTWIAYGGSEFAPHAYQATREQQITVAERVLRAEGWGAWPVCSRKAGAR